MNFQKVIIILIILLPLWCTGCLNNNRSVSNGNIVLHYNIKNYYQVNFYAYLPLPINDNGLLVDEVERMTIMYGDGDFNIININNNYYINISGNQSFIIGCDIKPLSKKLFTKFSSEEYYYNSSSNKEIAIIITSFNSINDEFINWHSSIILEKGWNECDISITSASIYSS